MKTSSNQVRQKPNAARSVPQEKSQPQKTVTLVFYSHQKDKVIARVNFPETVIKIIRRVAKQRGFSLAEFFQQAIAKKLNIPYQTGAISKMRGVR